MLATAAHTFMGTPQVCAHHLHTLPEPPSEPAGIRLSAELDRIILQCLAKSPSDRPADARALQRALEACPADATWSAAGAERWWIRFREVNGPSATLWTTRSGNGRRSTPAERPRDGAETHRHSNMKQVATTRERRRAPEGDSESGRGGPGQASPRRVSICPSSRTTSLRASSARLR